MFVFGVAGKSYAYDHIANALRETWGNDERLRSHDSALSQQLQSGHLAGGVHWSAEDNEWTEADYDCAESLDPWSSEWYDTEGYDDEYFPEETDWTENYYETSDYDNNDNTFSEHSPAPLDQPVETQEEDTSKLETVQEAVAAANAAADMSRRTWTQARQLMKDVHRSSGQIWPIPTTPSPWNPHSPEPPSQYRPPGINWLAAPSAPPPWGRGGGGAH